MQKRLSHFIHKHYLMTLSCSDNDQPWANAFYYVFDEVEHRLIYVTGEQTHHSKVMKKNPNVAGTIFTPTRFNPSLQGVQFVAQARMLEGKDREVGQHLYKKAYQHALIDQLSIWEVRLERVRLIDNSLGLFATINWVRGGENEETPIFPIEIQ